MTRGVRLALWLVACSTISAAAPRGGRVSPDWFFRESLAAIRDWEDILAAWEKTTPEKQRTPTLPVPADGQAVEWPSPFPLTLLPSALTAAVPPPE